MTEKYTWDVCDGDALFYDDGAVIDYDDVVDELNQLHEKNQQYEILVKSLKQQNQKLKLRLKDLGVEYF